MIPARREDLRLTRLPVLLTPALLLVVAVLSRVGITLPTVNATQHSTPTPVPAVQANADWTPVIQEFDGVQMVLVPAGCFRMGDENGIFNEWPEHELCFDAPFWIDRYEVSNAQFDAFNGQAANASYWPQEDRPREQISWFEARDFCDLRDTRLPTEAEWEYAARGPDSLIYPWDDGFEGTRLNFCDVQCGDALGYNLADRSVDDGYGFTAPIGNYPAGASWVGALDMSGNVWEWTSTRYDTEQFPYPYDTDDGRENPDDDESERVIRGGSFDYPADMVRAAVRTGIEPFHVSGNWGFRCARSVAREADNGRGTTQTSPTPTPNDPSPDS